MSATASARPLVQTYDASGAIVGQAAIPTVLLAPIRIDVIHNVTRGVAKNRRQPYAVANNAGEQTSAVSWGTGRAVSRIPRVHGGGTHRAGQGAFGNMCRGGRMYNPNKVWRRWHRRVNQSERRFAVASALAASAVPSLVMARGHRVESVPELPLVVRSDSLQNVQKTREAVRVLSALGAHDDVEKAKRSRTIRAGKGKMRNRRYVQRRGPLVIYNDAEENSSLKAAFRNLPGVEVCSVHRLNILQLAPGGHVGRFVVWTSSAFAELDRIYGTYSKPSAKKGWKLPRAKMTNADLARIINSDEVQSVLRAPVVQTKYNKKHRNPLRNRDAMLKLNPYHKIAARGQPKRSEANRQRRSKRTAQRKNIREARKEFYASLQ